MGDDGKRSPLAGDRSRGRNESSPRRGVTGGGNRHVRDEQHRYFLRGLHHDDRRGLRLLGVDSRSRQNEGDCGRPPQPAEPQARRPREVAAGGHHGELTKRAVRKPTQASFSIVTDAFEFVWVPPASVCSVTAAADEWFLIVRTSPAPRTTMAWPVSCWVPAPDP